MTSQPSHSPLPLSNALARASRLHQQGELTLAATLYREVVQRDPRHRDALHALGVIALQHEHRQDAIELFRRVLAIDPRFAIACANIGIALAQENRLDEALAYFDRALQLQPEFADTWLLRGDVLMALQHPQLALSSYDRVLRLAPDHAEALNNRGKALLDLQRANEALASLDRATQLVPDFAPAWNNRAVALLELGRPLDSIHSCEHALASQPDYAEAHYNRGNALLELRRLDEALISYDAAIRAQPNYVDALINGANTLVALRQPAQALAYCEQALAVASGDADAHNTRGVCLLELDSADQALDSFSAAVQIEPHFADAHSNRSGALMALGRPQDAVHSLATALTIAPDYAYAAGTLLHAQLHCCDWSSYAASSRAISQAVRSSQRVDLPFSFIAHSDSPAAQQQCARIFVADKHPPELPLWNGRRYDHDRIRVAYLSADFGEHAVAYSVASMIEHHDRARFETIGVALRSHPASRPASTPTSTIASRVRSAFERFIDVSTRSDHNVAVLLTELEVDIVVDITGHTTAGRPGILACRPAPIQVSYLGYPGTLGAGYVDYLIADPVVIPTSHEPAYDECIVRMPHCYLPADDTRAIDANVPSRVAAGLPATGFVFCAFNNSYKILPHIFDIWMRLLGAVPDSVLWLRAINPTATANLVREASARGVGSDRLVFAPRIAAMEQHLARYQVADLFLDTLPYNAHSTASDALWAGLPVLTCMGNAFAGRVAASMLHAVGLPELVTHSVEQYEQLALQLAANPEMLALARTKLNEQRTTQPLFDTARYCRNLESAYQTMWRQQRNGQRPAAFTVAE